MIIRQLFISVVLISNSLTQLVILSLADCTDIIPKTQGQWKHGGGNHKGWGAKSPTNWHQCPSTQLNL